VSIDGNKPAASCVGLVRLLRGRASRLAGWTLALINMDSFVRKSEAGVAVGEGRREVSDCSQFEIGLLGLHMLRKGGGRSGVDVLIPAMLDTECWVKKSFSRQR